MEKLKATIDSAPVYFAKSADFALDYVTWALCPALREELDDLYSRIRQRHEVNSGQYFIHYTSLAALVSMLGETSREEQKREDQKREDQKREDQKREDQKREDQKREDQKREDQKREEQKGQEQKPGPPLRNGVLRLYDSVHLNDPDEGNYLIGSVLKKFRWLRNPEESHAYIASFVMPDAKKDMSNKLTFWRNYGDEGEGCSLSLPVPRSRLEKVLYGIPEAQQTAKILSPVLVSLNSLVRTAKGPLRKAVQGESARVVWSFLDRIRFLYKSSEYEYENECRFVVPESDIQDKDKIRFQYQDQNNSPRIRHYYEDDALQINKLLVSGSSITLGPCVRYRKNVCFCLDQLKRNAGLSGTEIKCSTIPYRKS